MSSGASYTTWQPGLLVAFGFWTKVLHFIEHVQVWSPCHLDKFEIDRYPDTSMHQHSHDVEYCKFWSEKACWKIIMTPWFRLGIGLLGWKSGQVVFLLEMLVVCEAPKCPKRQRKMPSSRLVSWATSYPCHRLQFLPHPTHLDHFKRQMQRNNSNNYMPASAGDLRLMEVVGVKSKPDYNGEELRILFLVTWHQFSLMKSRQNCPRSEISSGGLSFSDWLNVCLGVKTVVPIGSVPVWRLIGMKWSLKAVVTTQLFGPQEG